MGTLGHRNTWLGGCHGKAQRQHHQEGTWWKISGLSGVMGDLSANWVKNSKWYQEVMLFFSLVNGGTVLSFDMGNWTFRCIQLAVLANSARRRISMEELFTNGRMRHYCFLDIC